jgi:hypothetical protein
VDDDPWPPPHPSPPLPPPREYGSPGTPPDRHPWLWFAVGTVTVAALLAYGLVLVARAVGHDGVERSTATEPSPSATATPTPATPATSTTPTPTPEVRCWDGTGAQRLRDCPEPSGPAGLAWVFPHLSEQKCGRPTDTAPGVVLRILCSARLSDGSRIQLGYYQWESVRAGVDFYEAQGLDRADANGFRSWSGRSGDTLKAALLYADAPFSQSVTFPAGAEAAQADLAILQPRPPRQLRGEPVG